MKDARNPPGLPAWLESFPEPVRSLDTGCHALFEASAGTGKTYAIEHLVLRLLVENPSWRPEEVLLLSFTEKTAADLRKRVRERLRLEGTVTRNGESGGRPGAAWSAEQLRRIREAWLHCDDLAVHTIHAFCHASLLRDPIANNALIRPDVLEDRALADEALESLLRGAWAKNPERLAALREALDIKAGDWWRTKLIRLALSHHPWRHDRIIPDRDPGTLGGLEHEAIEQTETLFAAVLEVERGTYTPSDHRKSFGDKKTHLENLRKDPFAKVFKMTEAEGVRVLPPAEQCQRLIRFFKKEFTAASRAYKNGFAAELPAAAVALPEWTRLAAACTRLRALHQELEDARNLKKLGLLAEAATELREELAREKRKQGAVSYDDMVKNLAEALDKNPGLVHKLRQRYKVCIVDEFQDTDSLQWKILRTLCLDETDDGEAKNDAERSKASPPPLFLVGDPKQAIYAFRGGDLQTYLAARAELRDLALETPPRAQGVGLTQNFRSRPALIEGLNAVFAQPAWFAETEIAAKGGAWQLPENSDDVVFTPVEAGRTEAHDATTKSHTARAAIWMRDFTPWENGRKADTERALRFWIAARIRDLIEVPRGFTVQTKGDIAPRPPRFGDIAILVRKNAEAEAIERLLRKRGIPCRVRRRGGVFHGAAADALRLLLDLIPAAADPAAQAKILLLPFLRRAGTDWPAGRPVTAPPLLARWALLARDGRWPEFFESVLRGSGYLDRLAEESASEAGRARALGFALAEAGSAPGTTAKALADRFDALRRGEGDGNEGAVAEEEESASDTPGDGRGAVTVMTLHMSKGLEFPVVFLAASGEGKAPDFFTLRDAHGFRHILDTKDAAAKAEHAHQAGEEDRRLFYVAFTRAMDRLYVPLLPEKYSKTGSGPLGDFAAQALRAAASESEDVFRLDEDPVGDEVAGTSSASTQTPKATQSMATEEEALRSAALAFAARRRLDSYSGLAKRAAEKAVPEDLLEEDGTRAVRESLPASVEDAAENAASVISREDLPAGAAAGNVLHKILEHTVFSSVLDAENPEAWLAQSGRRAQVEDLLRQEGLQPDCAGAVARAVWNTLRMPIPDPANPGGTIRLADNTEHLHEVEFLFPATAEQTEKTPEETGRSGNFLWGFIDLVFRHQGRYYLLDWKSNLLDDYEERTVREAMLTSGYDLQWQLYSVALDRWLGARLPDYDPAVHFGGVLYLYLRGAAPDRFSGFKHLPGVTELREEFPKRLAALLGLPPLRQYPATAGGAT
jgi:exodeoxyribonuclease V beta subunit